MAGAGGLRPGRERARPRGVDWQWLPWPPMSARSASAPDVGDEFLAFPAAVQGEFLARIERLLSGDARRGESSRLTLHLRGMSMTVDGQRHWVIYTVVRNSYVGVMCRAERKSSLSEKSLVEAIERSEAVTGGSCPPVPERGLD